MDLLNVLTLFATLLMIGVELSVSLFLDPAIWRLNDHAITAELDAVLGKVMPFWYGGCLVLLILEATLRRHQAGAAALALAALLWLLSIVYTLAMLVPINNRIAASEPGSAWLIEHKRWDKLHRWRVGLLLVAAVAFVFGLGLLPIKA